MICRNDFASQGEMLVAEPANARRLASSELSLPIYPFRMKDEVAAILVACKSFPWKFASCP
jgi:hypothetical protein